MQPLNGPEIWATGTKTYQSYKREWALISPGKPIVHCSNDPLLGGDETKYNPEDMLVASVASCHMLWYLHLCSTKGIVVFSYKDSPVATGELESTGAGRFLSIILKPKIEITRESDANKARALHDDIHQYCFIARSVNFPIYYEPEIVNLA